jgi:2-methylcitrate dehydratase PrpD
MLPMVAATRRHVDQRPSSTGRSTMPAVPPNAPALTDIVAGYVVNTKYESMSPEVVHKTKLHIRDGIGNQLGASSMERLPAKIMLDLLRSWGGAEQATVVGYGDRIPVAHAAMVNAMLGHGIELDDSHADALTKSGASVIPSVMAVAEFAGADEETVIVAAAIAYDVMARIGLAVNPSHRKRGYHSSGTVAPFATAAAAAKILGLDQQQVRWALGLAGMQAAGIQAFLDDPCMAKPFSPGKGAFNGVLAALLASRGYTGPQYVLEGKEGFLNAYADEVDTTRITDGLGESFKVMEMAFKPHAACRFAHGPIDLAQAVFEEEKIQPSDLVSVTVGLCELAERQSGRSEVTNLNSAMGSTPFSVAVALHRGKNGLADYREAFEMDAIHELGRSIKLAVKPEYGTMGRGADIRIETKDGRVIERSVTGPRGEPDMPLSDDELQEKFLGLAALAVGEEKAKVANEQLMTLDSGGSLATLREAIVR